MDTVRFSCSYGRLDIQYTITDHVDVRFDLVGPSAADSYAQLWQDGQLIGTRNGTPLFCGRDTEEGELDFTASYPHICNAIMENAHAIDRRLQDALQRGTDIDLSDVIRRDAA